MKIRLARFTVTAILGVAFTVATLASKTAVPGPARAFDFLVQNVCLNAAGNVLVGVSPIDGNASCESQRDLQIDEKLPYHERESGNPLRGSDSFPVKTRLFGNVAIHVYSYEAAPLNEDIDYYDPSQQIGGGTIAAVLGNAMSFLATQLGHQNLKLFVGEKCLAGQTITAAGLQNSWALAPLDKLSAVHIPDSVPSGSEEIAGGVLPTLSHIVDAGARCPAQMTSGTTRWSIRPVTYRAIYKSGLLKGLHVRLWTLVAERTGRNLDKLDTAVAFERAYFTRELGWTRWEAWKGKEAAFRSAQESTATASGDRGDQVSQANERVLGRQNCALPEDISGQSRYSFNVSKAPADTLGAPRSDLAMVGCIEVTDIIPPKNVAGDPAPLGSGSWYKSVVMKSAGSALFGH